MIHYTFENQKYYRENQEISADQAKYELGNSARWNWLNKTGKCNMREANLPEKPFVNSSKQNANSDIKSLKNISKVKEKVDKVVKTKEQKQLEKQAIVEEKLYQSNKSNYKVDHTVYKSGPKIELWRKNKKYGYYNFAAYLNDETEETLRKAIINDIYTQEKIAKAKKNKDVIQDDDI